MSLQLTHEPSIMKEPMSIPDIISTSTCIKPKMKSKLCCADGCKKKLSLTDFPCKCGKIHCSMHRAPEVHSCSYDYKSEHNKMLLKTMDAPVVGKRVEFI